MLLHEVTYHVDGLFSTFLLAISLNRALFVSKGALSWCQEIDPYQS